VTGFGRWMRRSAAALAAATLLTAGTVVTASGPAAADGSGQVTWGQLCLPEVPCIPKGLLRIKVFGAGTQIERIEGSFGSAGISNWRLRYELRQTDGTSARPYFQRDGDYHSATNASGKDTWNPDSFQGRTGEACVGLWSNGHHLQTACVSVTEAKARFRSTHSRRCIDADINDRGRNGNRIHLWKCNGDSQQQFRLENDGRIRSMKYRNQCLDADLNTIGRNGTVVQLWECNGTPQQTWILTSSGQIRNAARNQCLDADLNTIRRNGTVVQLWECNRSPQQTWY
jgi:hypothetical protein